MPGNDIELLFGVLGGGELSGASGKNIQGQLQKIVSNLNEDPLKVKIELDTETGGQKSWSSQLQTKLNAISESKKFSIQISKLKIGAGAVTDFRKQLSAVINTINLDKGTSITLTAENIGEIKSQAKDAAQEIAAFNVQIASLGAQQTAVSRLLNSLKNGSKATEEYTQVKDLEARYEQWAIKIGTIRELKKAVSEETKDGLVAEGEAIRDNISALLESAKAAEENASAQDKAAKETEKAAKSQQSSLKDVISAYKKVNDYIRKNPRVAETDDYKDIVSIRDKLRAAKDNGADENGLSSISKDDLRKLLEDFSKIDIALGEAGKKGKTFGDIIASAYEKFGGWMLITKSLMQVVRAMKQMVVNVVALDAAMTELRKVTDEADVTYDRFFTQASSRAKSLGATLVDTINSTADFARLGYSLRDAADLADAALVYKNVGDGIESISEASESVISTMKAFNIEASSAMRIVDKYNEVGNNFAISSSGVGEALIRSASALAAANNSLDESIALVTAANNVIQSPDKVGTALKTISMYLRAAKTEAEEAGESTEGMAVSVSKLREELLMLTNGRVDIQIDADTFKSTYQIMKELSAVWNDLTDITQANILEKIGGKRNSNVVTGLLSNFETAEEVLKTAANSAGSALAENEKYLDSINGKIAKLKSSFEVLSSTFIDSDAVKGFIDFGTGAVEILTKIVEMVGSLPVLIGSVTASITALSGAKGVHLGVFGVADGNKPQLASWVTDLRNGIASLSSSIGDLSNDFGVINQYNKEVYNGTMSTKDFTDSLKKGSDGVNGYISALNGSKASHSDYIKSIVKAGKETGNLGIGAKVASIGVTLLNTALNMIVTAAIAFAIQAAVNWIMRLANASKEAIERTKELNAEFKEFKDTNKDNIGTLESLKDEFETLSLGVSRYGENISLSAEQYERYKEIVQKIIDISPALSEGYSIENGYLADKNDLIERAIALQEQQYKNELRQMATTSKLGEALAGYEASYSKSEKDINVKKHDLQGSVWDLFNINDREDIDYGRPHGDDNSVYFAEQIIRGLGIENVEEELNNYFGENGFFQLSQFWDKYSTDVANNIGKIASNIDYSKAGFESLSAFEEAIERTKNAAVEYKSACEQLEQANQDVSNQLKFIAENNDAYADLSSEAKTIVSNFIDSFGVDDVTTAAPWYMFWKDRIVDEDAITSIKVQINDLIDKLTPEIQAAIGSLFDLKGKFDIGELTVDEFKLTTDAILAGLKEAGFDDNTIKRLRLSLETDMLDRQLEAVKEGIDGLDGQYDAVLGSMTSKELKYAYEIIANEGSMTLDELQKKIEWLKYANADSINVLDFSDMVSGLSDAKEGLDSIIAAMDRLNEGTAMTKEQLANLALQYPKLLEQADLFVDGSIEGQKNLLDTILQTHEAAYDAQLDEKIAELKASEQAINDQLDMETKKANIIAEIKNLSVNGQVEQEQELVDRITELNDIQGRNYVSMEDGILKVNEQALNDKLRAGNEFGEQAAENIWEPYGETIKSAHVQGFSKSLEATNSYSRSLFTKVKNIASNIWGALGNVVKDFATGNLKDISSYFSSIVSGDTSISAGDLVVTFDGKEAYVGSESIDSWVSKQEEASSKRIAALEDLRTRTINAYRNLEALRGLNLTGIYGSAGSGGSSGSKGSSGSGKSDADDTVKTVEEYLADIDAYYDAQKKLEELQERRKSLEKKLKYTDDPAEKIDISNQLIDSYRKEAEAERSLMDLKRQTIMSNVGALRNLGFQIEYNSDANKLYIKNLEHLNDLTATSAGDYETLQEATNALRKETESLIDATERLNEDNIDAIGNIEDLTYSVLEAKNNIIDYIEEIYEKQTDAYQKIIDLRKELIKSAKDEYDYESDVADKVKEIAELQARIDKLSLDDSRSAQAQKNTLVQELAEKQKELADTQRDHSIDAQIEALDKMADDYTEDKENEIELLRSTVNMSEELWTAFYQTILGQNVSIGNSIDSEIAGAWLRAAQAVKDYNSSVNGIVDGSVIVREAPKYHSGGVVNETNLNKDEALAILQKGEVVLNEGKQRTLYRIIDFQSELSKRLGVEIGRLSTVSSTIPQSGLPTDATRYAVDGMQNIVFEPHIDVTINQNGETKESDAQDYGEQIANITIDKLYAAFERRGISSNRGSRLRP